jgi:hypothetical protein
VKRDNPRPPPADPAHPSAMTLIMMMLAGLIRLGVVTIPEKTRHSCISICGLVVLATPLMLWISWSKMIFYIVLSSGGCAILIIWLLVRFAPEDYF